MFLSLPRCICASVSGRHSLHLRLARVLLAGCSREAFCAVEIVLGTISKPSCLALTEVGTLCSVWNLVFRVCSNLELDTQQGCLQPATKVVSVDRV